MNINFRNILLTATLLAAMAGQRAGAQGQCGTMDNLQRKLSARPQIMVDQATFDQTVENLSMHDGRGARADELRVIPVVVHIVHQYGSENISRQRVLDQLNTLNQCFRGSNSDTSLVRNVWKPYIADSKYEFRLATLDPAGNCTDGITRTESPLTNDARDNVKSVIQWNPDKYLNIWVVASIQNFGGSGTVLGYAQFPFDNDRSTDGIVMRADQMTAGNKTLTHEVGHYLGLYHTFETALGNGCTSSNCNSSGDRVCDTPPTTGSQSTCPISGAGQNSCTNDKPDLVDMVENFMDYSNCARMFSQGQSVRMDASVASASRRAGLFEASNLMATGTADPYSYALNCRPVADFVVARRVVCVGTAVQLTDISYNGQPTSFEWSAENAIFTPPTASLTNVRFTEPGTYSITLRVSNGAGADSVTKDALITVLPQTAEILAPLQEGFEAFDFKGWDLNSLQTVPSIGVINTVGATGTTSLLMSMDAFSVGDKLAFDLPPVDLTTAKKDKYIRWKIAYRKRTSTTNDELRVRVSTDCGNSYSRIMYIKTGTLLVGNSALLGGSSGSWTPGPNDWRLDSANLGTLTELNNLRLRFEWTYRGGSDVYFDDIQVGQDFAVGIAEDQAQSVKQHGLVIYPQPANHQLTIKTAPWTQNEPATIMMYDAAGRLMRQINTTTTQLGLGYIVNLDEGNPLESGIFVTRIQVANQVISSRVVVVK